MRKLLRRIRETTKDENFMHIIENIEVLVSKALSIFMVIVILVAMPIGGLRLRGFKNIYFERAIYSALCKV